MKHLKGLCVHNQSARRAPSLLSYHIHDGFIYLDKCHKALANTVEGIVCKGRKPIGEEEEGNGRADKARVTLGAQCLWDIESAGGRKPRSLRGPPRAERGCRTCKNSHNIQDTFS